MALAGAVFAGSLALLARGGAHGRLDLPNAALAVVASLPLVAWRRWPLGVLVVTTAASAALLALSAPGGLPLGPTVALYLLAATRDDAHPWTRGLTAIVLALIGVHAVALGLARDRFPTSAVVIGGLVWVVAWFAGERTRLRREQIAELEERARRAERDAERERDLAAAQERARIARDLHDSAGHAINVIGIQAGAARLLHDRDPARSRAALQTVEAIARQTAGEIDQMVRSLRDDDPTTAPPGLAGLDALIAQQRAAGLAVSLASEGERRPLGGAVDRAAYRILQEALTNAARHGDGAARVELAFGPAALDVVVTNPAAAAVQPRTNGGHGLVGMHERAAMLGGTLTAQRIDGAFRVHARLPYAR
jgi:signal transduction histidine kinase